MVELISLATEIRDLLRELNDKIDSLTGSGLNDLSDVISAVNDIQGGSGYDLGDVCSRLDQIDSTLTSIDLSTMG